jgi:hypothetical protein
MIKALPIPQPPLPPIGMHPIFFMIFTDYTECARLNQGYQEGISPDSGENAFRNIRYAPAV